MPSIDHEHFGPLRHRPDEGWIGRIHLPRFAEYHNGEFMGNLDALETDESVDRLREKTRHARRQQELAKGRFPLVIFDFKEEGPTEAQQQAFDFLVRHEAEVLEAVLQWVLDTYGDRGYWTLDGYVRDEVTPSVESLGDLKKCLRLESVAIGEDEHGTTTPITFHFSSSLDEEHGIEVTTAGAAVEDPLGNSDRIDPFSGRKLQAFPFELPESIDASAIEPSAEGHRFVELQYGGRWSGIFVLDRSLRCVGVVANSFPRPLADVQDIQDVRALNPLQRWKASLRVQRTVMTLVGVVNWFVALPCLVVAWMYEPRLFWACIALGLAAHALYFVFRRSGDHLFGLTTGHILLSVGGLIYASRVQDFGSQEHTAAVTGVFGLVLWWGTCAMAVLGGIILAVIIIGQAREFLRDGLIATLTCVVPGVFCVAALVLGLFATSSWHWPTLHLLWITPASLLGGLVLFLITMTTAIFVPSDESKKTPCPHCGKALATAEAKQCLHCGADWHRSSRDDESG